MPEFELCGYYPGAIGQVTWLHAEYYSRHWGLDLSFEAQVGRELSQFMAGFAPERDLFLAARNGNNLAGAVALDGGQPAHEGARIRWFIVDPAHQGKGLGRELLKGCLEFAPQAGHQRLFLWTFEGLDAARCLYDEAGFRLAEEHEVAQWGGTIKEQKLVLDIN